ncbi:proteinase inhibitor I4 serpin [Streptomyces davaonensis JCM 4913]|uniref:Proteinase inhibitor I4 serpin n=1 Tax=Streptomyces davaonensis (strain DSM 101723 / JCM 4913 / KCC S-0913 / 768) TaxID=1214101 RepID=K4R2W7_STRDJ|nr:serpin family protein [Streptomyces davaonensis]CCK27693.1 proteinase inhibitor I4 serpin [Streptomyces davaonensis JCM 4913]
MQGTNAAIRAVNGLTGRWAGAVEGSTVFSAVGVWPLLALLADGAADLTREELAEALGAPADRAAEAARELLGFLEAVDGLDSALGLWMRATLQPRPEWVAGLPPGAHGVLGGDLGADRKTLDAWAAERTGGLVEAMPVELTPLTELVLASALVLRTTWEEPFEGGYAYWLGAFGRAGLSRTTEGLEGLAVARTPSGKVTRVVVRGDNGLDVHLLLGEEEMAPGQVLGAGLDCLSGALAPTAGGRLKQGAAGPGLHVSERRGARPVSSQLTLDTVEFALNARHDLLARPELFGLSCADDPAWGGFPGISAEPLGVGSAGQSVTARFSAEGFRAAAVTAVGMAWLGAPGDGLPYTATTAYVRIDRPFGFLAVHRETRLALVAGWVTDPRPGDEDEFSG